MTTGQMLFISGLLGIAAAGLVWFGWDLVRNMASSLRAPRLPGSATAAGSASPEPIPDPDPEP